MGSTDDAAVLREIGKVVREEGAGQTRAEPQGERSQQDEPERALHPGTLPARPGRGARASRAHRRPAAAPASRYPRRLPVARCAHDRRRRRGPAAFVERPLTSNVAQSYPYASETEADRAAVHRETDCCSQRISARRLKAETTPLDPDDQRHWVWKCPTPGLPRAAPRGRVRPATSTRSPWSATGPAAARSCADLPG